MNKFCNTFDIKDFEKLSNNTKEKFRHLSKYIIKNSKGNIPLATIISNYYNKIPLENYNYILEPCSINALYNKEKNMYVIVFGEYHVPIKEYQKYKQKCKQKSNNNQVSIGTYIKQLVSTQPYFFDIFIEETYVKEFNFPVKGSIGIHNIKKEFSKCFITSLRDKTSYPNVRCHLSNLRESLPYNTLKKIISKQNIITDEDLKTLLLGNIKSASNVCNQQTIDKIDFKLFESIQKILLKSQDKVFKQYNKLLPEQLRKQIKQHVILYAWETYYKLDFNSNNVSQECKTKKSSEKHVKFLRNTIIRAPLLDYYILLRMFRTFENKNPYTPTTMNNIITYAGDAHAGMYSYVLDKLGFVSTYSKHICVEEGACIPINDFKFRQI
jgi:hypothetical protein